MEADFRVIPGQEYPNAGMKHSYNCAIFSIWVGCPAIL